MKSQVLGRKPHPPTPALPLQTLLGLVRGPPDAPITDKVFLEHLAAHRCVLVPPWILRAKLDGGLERVSLITYDRHMNLDKHRTLATVLHAIANPQSQDQERARDQARQAS